MNRREFMKLLGVGTTTVVFGTGLWTPPPIGMVDWHGGMVVVNPRVHQDLIDILENAQPIAPAFLKEFMKASDIRHEWLIDDIR